MTYADLAILSRLNVTLTFTTEDARSRSAFGERANDPPRVEVVVSAYANGRYFTSAFAVEPDEAADVIDATIADYAARLERAIEGYTPPPDWLAKGRGGK